MQAEESLHVAREVEEQMQSNGAPSGAIAVVNAGITACEGAVEGAVARGAKTACGQAETAAEVIQVELEAQAVAVTHTDAPAAMAVAIANEVQVANDAAHAAADSAETPPTESQEELLARCDNEFWECIFMKSFRECGKAMADCTGSANGLDLVSMDFAF